MKCDQCKKKQGLLCLDCKYCERHFCTRCIHLEAHACTGMAIKCEESLNNLEKRIAFSPKKKHDFTC